MSCCYLQTQTGGSLKKTTLSFNGLKTGSHQASHFYFLALTVRSTQHEGYVPKATKQGWELAEAGAHTYRQGSRPGSESTAPKLLESEHGFKPNSQ